MSIPVAMAAAARGSSARRARPATTGKGHRVRTRFIPDGRSDRDEKPGASAADSPGKQTLTQGVSPAATAIPRRATRRPSSAARTAARLPTRRCRRLRRGGLGAGEPAARSRADGGDARRGLRRRPGPHRRSGRGRQPRDRRRGVHDGQRHRLRRRRADAAAHRARADARGAAARRRRPRAAASARPATAGSRRPTAPRRR